MQWGALKWAGSSSPILVPSVGQKPRTSLLDSFPLGAGKIPPDTCGGQAVLSALGIVCPGTAVPALAQVPKATLLVLCWNNERLCCFPCSPPCL